MLESRSDLWAVVLAGGTATSRRRCATPWTGCRGSFHVADRRGDGEPRGPRRRRARRDTPRSRCSPSPAIGAPRRACCWPRTGSGAGRPAPWSRCFHQPLRRRRNRFLSHVAAAGAYVRGHPEWLLLLGVHPTGPALEPAGSSPGSRSDGRVAARSIGSARCTRSHRRSSRAGRAGSALCNTFAFTATVTALVDAGLACLPCSTTGSPASILFAGTRYETIALQQAYLFAPTADFSRAILASARSRSPSRRFRR